MQYEDAKAIMWLGLALFFAAGGIGIAYAMWRVGRMLLRIERDLHRTVDGVVPLIVKAGTSMDSVNDQLGKVDIMMDSAVDMVDAMDTTVRTVSHAVVEPVKAVTGAMAGVGAAATSFRDRVMDSDARNEDAPGSSEWPADAEASDDAWDDPFDASDDDDGAVIR